MALPNARRWRKPLLLLEALFWLGLAGLALHLLPSRLLMARLGQGACPPDGTQPPAPPMAEAEQALRITRTVRRAAHPLRLACLPQIVAIKAMLWRRGITVAMHLGSGFSPASAPVWLTLGRLVLIAGTGGPPLTGQAPATGESRKSAGS